MYVLYCRARSRNLQVHRLARAQKMLEYEFVIRNVAHCPVDRRAEGIRDPKCGSLFLSIGGRKAYGIGSCRFPEMTGLQRHYLSKLSNTPNKLLTPLSRVVQLHKLFLFHRLALSCAHEI